MVVVLPLLGWELRLESGGTEEWVAEAEGVKAEGVKAEG